MVVYAGSEHPWLREGEASDKPIDSAVLSRMKQFRAMNKLKKMALKVIIFVLIVECLFTWAYKKMCMQVIASNLNEEEIKGLKQMFSNMDTDNSGTITYEELKAGLAKLGSKLSEAEVKQLMDAVCTALELLYYSIFFNHDILDTIPTF